MEHSSPPINKDPRPVEAEAPKPPKPRWGFFELFGAKPSVERSEAKTAKNTEKVDVKEAKSEASVAKPKSLGEKLLGLLGSTNTAETPPSESPEAKSEAISSPEPKTPETPEAKVTIVDKVVEGARNIGGGVLRLIGRAREQVEAADAKEPGVAPTDVEPLAKAEAKVETAMDELDQAAETASQSGGGDFDMPIWQLRAQQEAAALYTQREVGRAIEAEVKRQTRRNRVHQTGALAVVSALFLGTEMYTWSKMRKMRKEQKLAEKRDFKQQEEILEKTHQIEELERRQVNVMDRAQRQEYVHEVSSYASAQAEHIQEAARNVRNSLAERPELHPANWPAERRAAPRVVEKSPEKPVKVADRAGEWLRAARSQLAATGGGFAGGAGHVFANLKSAVASKIKDRQKSKIADYSAHDTVQPWLNGALLLLGVVLLVAVLLAIF
jgi:hypothetical protein